MFADRTLFTGCLALCGLGVLSLFIGVIDLTPMDFFTDPDSFGLLAVSRFPRTAAAVITGASLSICGAIMQLMVRNRFVEPMTAGTGQGAALGILICLLFVPSAPIMVQMLIAAGTALAASLVFLAIVRQLPPQQPLLVPLVGLIYGGILTAGMVFFAYQADLLQYIDVWMTGEFSGVLKGRYELLWLAAAVAVATYFVADQFAIVGLGRTASINLGLKYEQIVLIGLAAISVVVAFSVVTVGAIPFVGLVVPNIVARLRGDNLRQTLPLIALAGAGLVLGCDILGRLIRYPFEIPVGTVFGVLGTLIFLHLLYSEPRRDR